MFSCRPNTWLERQPGQYKKVLVAALLTLLFLWMGHTVWRCTLSCDALFEIADGFAISKGKILYDNFIPTYGFLYPLLLSKILDLHGNVFTFLILLGGVWICLQMLLLAPLQRPNQWWSLASLWLLYAGTIAFQHNNENFVSGFSQSSVIAATLLMTGIWFSTVFSSKTTCRTLAFIAALILFIKEDFAVAGILIFIYGLLFIAKKNQVKGPLFLFAACWLFIIGLLLVHGARIRVLFWSALDFPLSSDVWASDPVLRLRMFLIAAVVVVGTLCMRSLQWKNRPRPSPLARPVILLLVCAVDGVRYLIDPGFHAPLIQWLSYAIAIHLTANLVLRVRRRGFSILKRRPVHILVLPLIVVLIGYSRVAKSGWYPFSMYEPFALLVFWRWLTRDLSVVPFRARASGFSRAVIAAFCLLASLHTAYSLLNPSPYYRCETRLGWMGLAFSESFRIDVLKHAEPFKDTSGIFSTDPLLPMALNIPPVNLHSGVMRLQLALPVTEMEARLLNILQASPPKLVFMENLRNPGRKRFGADHAVNIWQWISREYEAAFLVDDGFNPYSRKTGATLYREKLDF